MYHMHEMYQLCWTVSPNLISIPSPSLLYHGVVFVTITLKHYCVYKLKCYDRDSHRMAGPWSVGFGYGIQSNWYGQLKDVLYISSQCILLPSDWWSDSQWYLVWPWGVSNQINWLVCNDRGSTNMTLNDLHSFDMTASYRHYTILHCTSKPCRDHSVRVQTIRACVVL